MLQQCGHVHCNGADAYTFKRIQITHVPIRHCHVLVQRVGLRQLSGTFRRQLARCPATTSSSTIATPNSPSGIARTLRDLAKAPIVPRDHLSRAKLDGRIDTLVTQFRLTTADGTLSNNRDLGSIVWSLAKLSTPCCCGHAIALLTVLTAASSSSPASLQSASNQTLCKALYGAALLSRTAAAPITRGSSSSKTPTLPTPWPALLPPARALAEACVPRLASFNMLDTSNVWWAIATLASLSPPPSAVSFGPATPFPSSGGLASSKLQKQLKQQTRQRHPLRKPQEGEEEGSREPRGVFSLPEGLLAGLASAAERHMRTMNGCSTQGMANMLWAASRLGYADERMLAAAVALLKPQVRTLASTDSRAFATSLWALASLRYTASDGLLSAASRPAAAHVGAFDDQSLANLLWAYGTSGVEAPKLFTAAADELARRANRMPIEFLAICMWAFATANHLDPNMMAVVAHSLTGLSLPPSPAVAMGLTAGKRPKRGRQAASGGMASAASAVLGPVGLGAEADWETALAERLVACQGRRTQAIGNLAWAYAALGARHDPLILALAGRAAAMATALNAQELSNVLYSIARLMPCITDTRPDVLEVLLQEIDRRVALGQGQHDQPGSTRRNRRNQLPHQPESSSTKCLASQTDWAVTAQVEQPVMSGLMCHSPYGRPGVGGLSPAQLFNPRDLAMLAWSLAILAPASPTLRRILTAAVASVNISIADAPSTATDKGDAADAGGTELGELQTQPYNLFGLVQLYGANYAACLAAATTGASGGDVNSDKQEPKARVLEMDVTEGDGDGDCSYSESCGDGGCNECGDGGGGGGGGRSDAAAALVRAAAAAMLQAQRAAEAIGGAPASSINECNSNSDGPYTRKAASAAGEEEDGRRRRGGGQGGRGKGGGDTSGQSGVWREMVRFGPLGACPPLFRACRDAWFLNTASTKPSDLQTAVAAVLRNRRLGGGGGGGTIDSSASGSCGGGVAGQTRGVVFVAEEVLTPDRMLRVDLLVQYDGWLVLLEVDGPSHFAVELYGKQVNTSNGDSSSVSRIADATMRGRDGTGTGSNDDDGAVQDDLISATACPTSCGTENEENQCHGDADFSGRVDDGNEEEARLVTASAGKVRSARGDSKLPAAAAVALRRQGLLRPLGDTVLRNRFLAASLGLRAAGFREGGPAVLTHTGANDPWVIESLLVQLPRGEGAKEEDGKGRLASTARSGEGGYGCAGLGMGRDVDAVGSTAGITGTNGSHGGGASDGVSAISSSGSGSGLVRGVALTTLSYADWNAAGNSPRDKWARCLQPLLVRCLG